MDGVEFDGAVFESGRLLGRVALRFIDDEICEVLGAAPGLLRAQVRYEIETGGERWHAVLACSAEPPRLIATPIPDSAYEPWVPARRDAHGAPPESAGTR